MKKQPAAPPPPPPPVLLRPLLPEELEALQEFRAENESLAARNAELESRLPALEQELKEARAREGAVARELAEARASWQAPRGRS